MKMHTQLADWGCMWPLVMIRPGLSRSEIILNTNNFFLLSNFGAHKYCEFLASTKSPPLSATGMADSCTETQWWWDQTIILVRLWWDSAARPVQAFCTSSPALTINQRPLGSSHPLVLLVIVKLPTLGRPGRLRNRRLDQLCQDSNLRQRMEARRVLMVMTLVENREFLYACH